MKAKRIVAFLVLVIVTMMSTVTLADEPLIKQVPAKEGIGSFLGIPLLYLQDAVSRSTNGCRLNNSVFMSEDEALNSHHNENECLNTWHLITPDNKVLEMEFDSFFQHYHRVYPYLMKSAYNQNEKMIYYIPYNFYMQLFMAANKAANTFDNVFVSETKDYAYTDEQGNNKTISHTSYYAKLDKFNEYCITPLTGGSIGMEKRSDVIEGQTVNFASHVHYSNKGKLVKRTANWWINFDPDYADKGLLSWPESLDDIIIEHLELVGKQKRYAGEMYEYPR